MCTNLDNIFGTGSQPLAVVKELWQQEATAAAAVTTLLYHAYWWILIFAFGKQLHNAKQGPLLSNKK